jgi:hypothetical protein
MNLEKHLRTPVSLAAQILHLGPTACGNPQLPAARRSRSMLWRSSYRRPGLWQPRSSHGASSRRAVQRCAYISVPESLPRRARTGSRSLSKMSFKAHRDCPTS